jgi:hypothetical protein
VPRLCAMARTRTLLSLTLAFAAALVSALVLPRQTDNDGVHLAIAPPCGAFGGAFANANAGVDLSAARTLVVFGVRPFSSPRARAAWLG